MRRTHGRTVGYAGSRAVRLAWNAEYYQDHKEAAYAYRLRRVFGLTLKAYLDKLAEQEGRCAICRVSQLDVVRRFAVDHDHVSGAIRGLLCVNCNRGIGNFRDDPSLLQAAMQYLGR